MVLHPLQDDLDRLGPEVEPTLLGRERVRLVDEEDAVECAPDDPLRLDRREADVLPDEPGPVDLDKVALPEEAECAVHLREQSRDRRLPRPRVAEEDEVLRRGDLGEPVLLPSRLHLEEGDERVHLLLHRVEADECVQLGLDLLERPQRRRAAVNAPPAIASTGPPGWRSWSPMRPIASRRSSKGSGPCAGRSPSARLERVPCPVASVACGGVCGVPPVPS